MHPRAAAIVVMLTMAPSLHGQEAPPSSASFRARLSTVPIDLSMQPRIAGSGTATVTLRGHDLIIEGSFRNLVTPATTARVHRGPDRGLRGPAIGTLTADAATSGAISGTIVLTEEQVGDLEKGRLYIQLHSEKAPEGNLWGWILRPATRDR